jgi:hypothetical protein
VFTASVSDVRAVTKKATASFVAELSRCTNNKSASRGGRMDAKTVRVEWLRVSVCPRCVAESGCLNVNQFRPLCVCDATTDAHFCAFGKSQAVATRAKKMSRNTSSCEIWGCVRAQAVCCSTPTATPAPTTTSTHTPTTEFFVFVAHADAVWSTA